MLKKTITYNSYDGITTVTEDFYFNLNEAELSEMHLSMKGGLDVYLRKIMAEEDSAAIITMFKEILWKAIGQKSEDGKRFIKNDDIWFGFCQTDAYNVLFMELLTDSKAAAEFIKGIVPAKMAEKIDPGTLELSGQAKDDRPAWVRENREPTRAEMIDMSKEDLVTLMQRKMAANEGK